MIIISDNFIRILRNEQKFLGRYYNNDLFSLQNSLVYIISLLKISKSPKCKVYIIFIIIILYSVKY